MDHAYMEETQLAERYVLGRAGEAERIRFEEHFADCPACLDRLEAAEGLRSTLRDLAAARLLGSHRAQPHQRSVRARRIAFLAAAAGLAAAALSTLLYFQMRQSGRQLVLAREAAAQAQAALGRRSVQPDRAVAAPPAALAPSVPVAAPVFLLNLTRGGGQGEPENRVAFAGSASWVTLVFEQPDDSALRYRIRVIGADGQTVQEAIVARSRTAMLSLTLPSASLAAGGYVLTVEQAGDGRAGGRTRFRFRVFPGN
jgi:hypothetical protein